MLIPKASIANMATYMKPKEGRLEKLRLDFNENLRGASPKVLEAIARVSRESYGCYPEYEKLYQALAIYFGLPEGCFLATNGSDEGIRTLFDAYVEKGDEVLLLTPSYSMYEHYARIASANIIWIDFRQDFSFPIEEILGKISSKTRLIALASPNNPTGLCIKREHLIKIIEAHPSMVVLIDEAYSQFARVTHRDLISYPNVFIAHTFSKAFGLAGLRIGCLISAETNIQVLSKVLAPAYSVDCLAVAGCIAALEDPHYVQDYVKEIATIREFVSTALTELGFEVIPSQANFILVKFGQLADKIEEAAAQQGILVRRRRDLPGYLRITIGPHSAMQQFIQFLQQLLAPRALVFDMDGVLVDESGSYRMAILKTVEHFLGRPVAYSEVESFKAQEGYNNDYDCSEAILLKYGIKLTRESLEAQFDAIYRELKSTERWMVEKSLLLQLKQKFRLGIFTGRPRKDAWEALKRFKMEELFESVVTDDDVKFRKPDPEGLKLVLERLKTQKAIYFGDTRDDELAAAKAAVEFVKIVPPGKDLAAILEKLL